MDHNDQENIINGQQPEESPAPNKRHELYEWIEILVSTIVVCVLLFSFVLRPMSVDGSSMLPTLEHGDKMIVSDLFYTPKQGDIVVLTAPDFGDEPLVKRVIAVENQTIDINFVTGEVIVDGVVLDEPYIAEPTHEPINFSGPVTVPEGCVFVMGDNRNASSDSRDARVGFVDEREILGKVYFVVFPLGNFKFFG